MVAMEHTQVFIIGIKGAAMCHIAVMLQKMGKTVTGADTAEQFITDEVLAQQGISYQVGFDPASLPQEVEAVIYSAAHGGLSNPLAQEAVSRGLAVYSQAELLGELMKSFRIAIAVCGTHGKTTTASLLSYALMKLGANPSYLIGSSSFTDTNGKVYSGGAYNGHDYFVLEADEYGVNPPQDKTPKFLLLKPTHILCTNVDYDHPDVYGSLQEVKDAFKQFFSTAKASLFYCADNRELVDIVAHLQMNDFHGFGLSGQSEYKVSRHGVVGGKTVFSLESADESVTDIQLSIYGEKNVSNAAGVVALLLNLGFTPDEIKDALCDFSGPKRRMEVVFQAEDTVVLDDYAHHPVEISVTINALKTRYPDRRIIVLFQPHTYSRTNALAPEFTKSLAEADYALVLPVFASAREETPSQSTQSVDLAAGVANIQSLTGSMNLQETLRGILRRGDVVVTMGAGDVYKRSTDIIDVIRSL